MYRNDQPQFAAQAPRPGESRRFALKRATDAAHTRVEGIIGQAGMFSSPEGYRRYLAATLDIRTRYEALMDASDAAAVWPAWPGRRIAPLVAQDLADLGGRSPPFENVAAKPFKGAELLGALYVLEGSSLGARVLSKSVQQFGLSASHGARHLHAQAGDAAIWRDFVDLLDRSEMAPCHATANRVFDDFAAAYQRAAI